MKRRDWRLNREFVILHDDSNEHSTDRKNLEEIALKLDILNPDSLSDKDLRQSIKKNKLYLGYVEELTKMKRK
jgi:hypothetical protein